MLQVWIEDSGRGQKPVFVLAGYVGRAQNWVGFANEWTELLKKSGLAYLKGKEARPLSDQTVLRFVALIRRYVLVGVRVVVPHRDFHESLKRDAIQRDARWYFKQPYYLAFDCVFGGVTSWARKRPNFEKIEFNFDNGVVDRRSLNAAYGHLLNALGSDAALIEGEPVFRDDKLFSPLQAADLLAWYVRRDYHERTSGRTLDSPVWRALEEIDEIQIELNRHDLDDVRAKTIARMTKGTVL